MVGDGRKKAKNPSTCGKLTPRLAVRLKVERWKDKTMIDQRIANTVVKYSASKLVFRGYCVEANLTTVLEAPPDIRTPTRALPTGT